MKIATQNQAFFPSNILEKFEYIKAMGFDGYEIDGKLLVENLAEVKAAIKATGLPVTTALAGFGLLGALTLSPMLLAAALGGALLGFAPFNRPGAAKVFLGDVGSLPIGLLLGWCLLQLAVQGHVAAALLLPLYYLADSTLTLLRRMIRREPFWLAHRSHFYQRATDNGFSVREVVGLVFLINLALALLAGVSIALNSIAADGLLLAVGVAVVAALLVRFARPKA